MSAARSRGESRTDKIASPNLRTSESGTMLPMRSVESIAGWSAPEPHIHSALSRYSKQTLKDVCALRWRPSPSRKFWQVRYG